MGVGELRQAFDSVAGPAGFTCTLALLDYQRAHDTEFQILLFRGTDAAGAGFEIKSDPLRANSDLNQAAKEVAQRLLDQRKPRP
jgi:hypothetical protein